jgi:hypothetical protein
MHHQMMPHMSGMGHMMGPMMRAMAFAPAHLLERREALNLTEQQAARLTTLRDEAARAHDTAAAEARRHMEALETALQGNTVDTTALRRHFQAAHTAMGTAHWAVLRASAQARGVLNEAQRARVEGWIDAMQTHGPMRGWGGRGWDECENCGP